MNDKLKTFMTNIAVMCELWAMVYHNFTGQGMNQKDALMHTQAFMGSLVTSFTQGNTGKE